MQFMTILQKVNDEIEKEATEAEKKVTKYKAPEIEAPVKKKNDPEQDPEVVPDEKDPAPEEEE